MIAPLEHVVDALRNELQHYGELLALLETQTGILEDIDFRRVLDNAHSLNTHRTQLGSIRKFRLDTQEKLAWALGLPEARNFKELLPAIPECYHPLLEALIGDINHAISQAHSRAAANHASLCQALARTEQLIATISSQGDSALLVEERKSTGADSPQDTISAGIV